MRQHYERRKQDRPEFISDTDAFDVTAYMNGAAAKRIRHRVYLLKNCGIEPGSYLKTLVEVNGNQVLYEASMNFVFETNLEALPKHVPSHLTAEMLRLMVMAAARGLRYCDVSSERGLRKFARESSSDVERFEVRKWEVLLERRSKEGKQIQPADSPPGISVDLHDYQCAGLAWMLWRERQSVAGGILAYEMGLGKTLISLAVVLHDKFYKTSSAEKTDKAATIIDGLLATIPSNATLVVGPKSAASVWKGELAKRLQPGTLTVYEFSGTKHDVGAEELAEYDVVIATYNAVVAQVKEGGPSSQIEWRRVFLDEAHAIRNPRTDRAKACAMLRARYRWCVTGTPINNGVMDLYSLFWFLRVPNLTFIKKHLRPRANVVFQMKLATALCSAYALRKKKTELQNSSLPPMTEVVKEVNLGDVELELFRALYLPARQLALRFLNAPKGHRREALGQRSADVHTSPAVLRPLFADCRLWKGEIAKRLQPGTLTVYDFSGIKRNVGAEELADYDIVIATYNAVVAQVKEGGPSSQIEWRRVFLDEAHAIRNPRTDRAKACAMLRARYRWCVTGTPINNGVMDLYSLFWFLRVPNLTFIKKHLRPRANVVFQMKLATALCSAYALRKKKTELQNSSLPPMTEVVKEVNLGDVELELFRALYLPARDTVAKHWDNVLQMYTRLRQCCVHFSLIADIPQVMMEKLFGKDVFGLDIFDPMYPSAKIQELLVQVPAALRDGHKCVVASQWTEALDIVKAHLKRLGISYSSITGDDPGDKRLALANEFNKPDSEPQVMLLSLKVAESLTLTGASRLFLLDPHYNLANELQLFHRIHRIGQQKETVVT
ncbi:domain proteinSNF2 family, partial [Aphelenchoides avenae]